MKSNVAKFPLQMNLRVNRIPSAEEAYIASMDFTHLQHLYPMLGTVEERENNMRNTRQCLEIMNAFILSSFLKSRNQEPVH